jgi:dolichol-phosphate mannosyltransferase
MEFLRAHLTPGQRRFVKFLVVGASGVPVNLGVVFLVTQVVPAASLAGVRDDAADAIGVATLTAAGVRDAVAYGCGIFVSILTNFLLNNWWTWGDRTSGDSAGRFWRRLVKFYLVSTIAAAVQLGTSTILSAWLRGSDLFSHPLAGEYRVYHAVAPAVGILVGLVINFGVNNLWTFRRRSAASVAPRPPESHPPAADEVN